MAIPNVGDFYIQESNQDFWLRELVGGVPMWVRKGNIRDEGTSGLLAIQPILDHGILMGVQVDRWRFLGSMAEDMGFDMAAAVDRIRALSAAQGVGFDMAVVVTALAQAFLASNMAFGFSQATTLSFTAMIAASEAMGFSQASALTLTTILNPLMIEGDLTSPFVHFYNSSLTKLADPATLPSAGVQAVALSPDKKTAAVATATAIFIYDLTSGAPVKVTGIASPPSWVNITAVRFSPDSSKLLVTDNTASPFVWVYNTSTWVLTTTPSVGAVGGVQNGCFSPDGTKIALCLGGGTFLSIYNVSTGVITTGPTGTALPSTTCRGISWSPDGSKLAVATGASEFICYRTDTWAQITVSPQPSGAVAGLPDTCAFSPGSDRLVFCIGSSPWLVSFTISGNTLTAEAAPATTPTAQGRAVSFSSDGTKAFIGNAGTTKLMTYNIPGWTRATDAGTQPAGNPFDVFCLF